MKENLRRIDRSVCWLSARLPNFHFNHFLSVIYRFFQNLQSALTSEKLQKLQLPDPPCSQDLQNVIHTLDTEKREEEENHVGKASVYKRRRKREQQEADCCHDDGESSSPDLYECLDLFTWTCGSAHTPPCVIDWTAELLCLNAGGIFGHSSATFMLKKSP